MRPLYRWICGIGNANCNWGVSQVGISKIAELDGAWRLKVLSIYCMGIEGLIGDEATNT